MYAFKPKLCVRIPVPHPATCPLPEVGCCPPVCRPLCCLWALACLSRCDKAEAVAVVAGGHRELTPARRLGLAGRWVPLGSSLPGHEEILGGGCCQKPARDLSRWMWSGGCGALKRLAAFPGRGRWAPFKTLNLQLSSSSVWGGGRRFSKALLNQADRLWLLLSLCWCVFFPFPPKHPKHFQPLAQRSESGGASSPNREWVAGFARLCKRNVVSL